MSILNYTTQIAVEKTVGEIQKLLAGAGAQAVMTEYDSERVLTAISFRILCPFGMMSFRLPANVDKIFTVVKRSNKIPASKRTREQAARVAWRIIKDWLEAQLALIQAEMVQLEQVFLPYAQNREGQTVYETFQAGLFQGLALPSSQA